jgi:hypothetical protein
MGTFAGVYCAWLIVCLICCFWLIDTSVNLLRDTH